eukprot:CAMPEP_0184682394 /NCGR_PEP_ID=MMETSP0312-20130426/7100_1 /TAXON_ID=31354 /ORGANISM="Compsopogon coeruleus, Strain SAG 36.94" /LENGTH=190 /DNA_ID=CAMNT_0027134023 /DNA_START=128 /DNA_END=697 /DNA_ORIENTATION=-
MTAGWSTSRMSSTRPDRIREQAHRSNELFSRRCRASLPDVAESRFHEHASRPMRLVRRVSAGKIIPVGQEITDADKQMDLRSPGDEAVRIMIASNSDGSIQFLPQGEVPVQRRVIPNSHSGSSSKVESHGRPSEDAKLFDAAFDFFDKGEPEMAKTSRSFPRFVVEKLTNSWRDRRGWRRRANVPHTMVW